MKKRIYRIAAVVVAVLFCVSAWLFYRGEFLSLRTDAQKVEAAEDYVRLSGLVVFGDETLGKNRILTFTDASGQLLGDVQFRRGILGGWQPVSAGYSSGDVMASSTVGDTGYLVVYAADCPPEIAHYKVQANPDLEVTLMAEGDVTSSSFLHVYQPEQEFFPMFYLYDAQGQELDSRDYFKSNGSTGIGSAEVNMVYWVCAIWLGIGWLLVKYLWDASKKETVS